MNDNKDTEQVLDDGNQSSILKDASSEEMSLEELNLRLAKLQDCIYKASYDLGIPAHSIETTVRLKNQFAKLCSDQAEVKVNFLL